MLLNGATHIEETALPFAVTDASFLGVPSP
jgi:hypothetical protein